MKKVSLVTITLLSMLGLMMGNANLTLAQSLYPVDKPSLFEDKKARRPGDLVTVIIVEQAQARQTARTDSGKDSEVSIGPGGGVLADLIPLLRMGGGDSFSADGSTTRGGSLTAKITTKVMETYANNTMLIEGRQKIVVNGEEQEIVLTGLVRGEDVAPDNTVLSTFVADAEISFVGTGVVGDKNKPGIITRLFNWLF
ncbi:MAG TPA: flagellar basal body L-ring protein FlgH [Firmicutes bacterium]|mgnify:CR=1 FL=1|nr:flagellar basal body L-ring protein FlgH [Bacillota bacterium]HHT42204.1 flagellar basal body L-ring protein FlgH [Bacillota bacterium]